MAEAQHIARIHIRKSPQSDWLEVLNVPVGALSRFVINPNRDAVKYLKYLAFCLTGSDGCLSRSSDPGNQQNIQEAGAAPPEGLSGSFYFFPLSYEYILADPDVQACSISSTSETSSSYSILPDSAIKIYGHCPFTGAEPSKCDNCHLIPRRKGPIVCLASSLPHSF